MHRVWSHRERERRAKKGNASLNSLGYRFWGFSPSASYGFAVYVNDLWATQYKQCIFYIDMSLCFCFHYDRRRETVLSKWYFPLSVMLSFLLFLCSHRDTEMVETGEQKNPKTEEWMSSSPTQSLASSLPPSPKPNADELKCTPRPVRAEEVGKYALANKLRFPWDSRDTSNS